MKSFFDSISTRFLVFALATTGIVAFIIHPTSDFLGLANLLVGGFLGYITAELKVSSSDASGITSKFTLTKE